MYPKTYLITGANGEIGHGLIRHLAEVGGAHIIAIDLVPLDPDIKVFCHRTVVGDILDSRLLGSLSTEHNFDTIFHLAALLSTRAERQPPLAHQVNVDGTLQVLEIAITQSRLQGRPVKFIFPSSIAVYGIPDLETKNSIPPVWENQWLQPITMYGINKLYCEHLGRYYATHYRQLDAEPFKGTIDFRVIRFPGIISALTLPTGGTSDFASEMLHASVQGKLYACFVRENTRIPFMAMPDAIEAILKLHSVPSSRLTQRVYNVKAYNPTAREFFIEIQKYFPDAAITFLPDEKRQRIVDSWPADVDDTAARTDWDWKPELDFNQSFETYFVPMLKQRYKK